MELAENLGKISTPDLIEATAKVAWVIRRSALRNQNISYSKIVMQLQDDKESIEPYSDKFDG